MPESCWRGPLAFVAWGAVSCALTGWFAWGLSADQTEIRMSREQSSSQHIEYAQDRIRQTCLDRGPATFLECATVEIVSAQDHGRAESDLDAQQSMALWAKLMTLASLAALGVTAVGVYLVWGTLEQTRVASKAAQDAVIVAQEVNHKQLRPWLISVGVSTTFSKQPIFEGKQFDRAVLFAVRWKNTGNSPAACVNIYGAIRVIPAGSDIPAFDATAELGTATVGMGTDCNGPDQAVMGDNLNAFLAGSSDVILYGLVKYRGSFSHADNWHTEATYRAKVNGSSFSPKGEQTPNIEFWSEGPQNSLG